jgi:predicted ferric reductase
MLQYASLFYDLRWKMFRLLNHRIPLSRVVLRKVNVFLTFGDLLSMSPLLAALAVSIFYSFICPSVSVSGHAACIPLIFAFITAMRNSPLTLLIGIPFERALWYHKWSARVAYVNGLFHTYACFVYPVASNEEDGILPKTSLIGSEPNLWKFLFANQVNCGGSFLIIFMSLMMVTAFRCVRRRFFEAFQYFHMAFIVSMIVCAFNHTGIIVPICATFSWWLDLLIRKVYMPLYRYPKFASLRIISETVLEFCFPKSPGFDYNPGQCIYICIPEISFLEWHPFSLSSSPEQKIVTLHIRNAGNWMSRLFDLAKSRHEVSVLLEGPYGSVGVDLISNEYKSIILLSGGIGVTPMQSLCNQLMYDHRRGIRKLNKLSFIWVERDPHVMPKVDVIRRHISSRYSACYDDVEIGRDMEMQHEVGIASTLLSIIPASTMNEDQFEQEYASSDIDDDDFEDDFYDEESAGQNLQFISTDDDTMNQTFLDDAYCGNNEHNGSGEPLDLQVYLTSKEATKSIISNYSFVRHSRPDVPLLFKEMRLEALARGEKCVAVCVCAPKRLVLLCAQSTQAGAYVAQNVHKTKCPHPGYGRYLEILILLWCKTSKLQIGCFVMHFVFRVFYKVFQLLCRPTKHLNTNRLLHYTYRPSH